MHFKVSFILISLFVPYHCSSLENEIDVCDKSTQKCPDSGLTALLLGGTGATGKHVLNELHASDQISKIVFITRRNIEFPDMPKVTSIKHTLIILIYTNYNLSL